MSKTTKNTPQRIRLPFSVSGEVDIRQELARLFVQAAADGRIILDGRNVMIRGERPDSARVRIGTLHKPLLSVAA